MSGPKTQGSPHRKSPTGLVGATANSPASTTAAAIAKDPPHITRCVNCVWGQDRSLDDQRRCRRRAPAGHFRQLTVAQPSQILALAVFPVVNDSDYCGEGVAITAAAKPA